MAIVTGEAQLELYMALWCVGDACHAKALIWTNRISGPTIIIGSSVGGIGNGIDSVCPTVDDELSIWIPVGWLVIN